MLLFFKIKLNFGTSNETPIYRKLNLLLISNIYLVCSSPETQRTEAAVPRVFCRKGVFEKLAKFTGKHMWSSLFFNKGAGLRPIPLLKKRLWHRCFPIFRAIFKRTFFEGNLWRTGSERRLIHTKVYYSQKKTTHKPSKVAASKNKNSSVCMLLVQPP